MQALARSSGRNEVAGERCPIDLEFADALAALIRIAHLYVVVAAAKRTPRGEARPCRGQAGVEAQAVVIGLDAEEGRGHGDVIPYRSAGEPRNPTGSEVRTEGTVGRLADRIRLHLPDFRAGVEPRRQDIVQVFPCPVAISEPGGGHHGPSLGVIKNAAVLFASRIEEAGKADVRIGLHVRRGAKHEPVFGGKMRVHGFKDLLCPFAGGMPAEDRPHLRIHEDASLFGFAGTEGQPIEAIGAQIPFPVPCVLLDAPVQFGESGARPMRFLRFPEEIGNDRVFPQGEAQLKGHEDRFPVFAKANTVVPVVEKAAGEAVPSAAVEREFEGAAQVFKNARFPFIGKRQGPAVKGEIPGFLDIGRNGIEQPHPVVRAELLRRFLRARAMVKRLDHRLAAAVRILAGEQKLEPLAGLCRDERGRANEILQGIAIAKAVALAGVDEAGGPRPIKGHEVVQRHPQVDHGIEGRFRRLRRENLHALMPEVLHVGEGLFPCGRALHQGDRFLALPVCFANAEESGELDGFARPGLEVDLQGREWHVSVSVPVGAGAVRNGLRRGIGPIRTEKCGEVAVKTGCSPSGKGKEAVPLLVFIGEVLRIFRHVRVGGDIEDVADHPRLGNVLVVLQVFRVVGGVPVALRLGRSEQADTPLAAVEVADGDGPDFVRGVQGDEVSHLATDIPVQRGKDRIARTVAAFRVEAVERLAHGHP